ncbi:alpha/beta fold hydrolase [Bradyrhizobium aeschynomenes]|uniref:alpha/beta fold hydrolase n=1 Tax=Bradyrhizobium aeschynomenes TaxID=2734909 RepID=UPI0015566E8C|nr:alpha/beta hydrolase [Bradyrhizobium aeschynomenes]NPV22030.1 alpha/beta hydrolase [Bradyrhizobium aeschynomenes]
MSIPATSSASLWSVSWIALKRHPAVTALAGVAAVATASAIINWQLGKKAERDNPPAGEFIEVDGVRLHYVERGHGRPLVLLHGNGSMIQDFQSSGLIDLAAQNYRVIAFDRPGFGHSSRPRDVVWTPEAQADLFVKALERINVSRAIVLGHSWGASVALAMATRHPSFVEALVLASGYYYPTVRADVAASSIAAIPGLGDIITSTISPLLSRLMWPSLMRKMFGPRAIPDKFAGFPKEMAVRPSQIRASAAESTLMIAAAFASSRTCGELDMPTIIIAGEDDRVIDITRQSVRLHEDVKRSRLHRIAGAGHMIQQSATPELMAAVDEAAAQTIH